MIPEDFYFNFYRDVKVQEWSRGPITAWEAVYYLGLLCFIGFEFFYLTVR